MDWSDVAPYVYAILLALVIGLAGTLDYEDRVNNLTDMRPSERWLQNDY